MHGNILLERSLPLKWGTVEAGSQLLNTDRNHLIFSLLDSLEEPSYHKTDTENSSEIARIEAKLNVIMHLLGQLLHNQQSPMPVVTVRFTSDSLAWQVEQPLSHGNLVQVSLILDERIPLAINFEARVLRVKDGWMEVDMHGLDEDDQAKWLRWVFRQHRRQVAQSRTIPASQAKSD